VAKTATIERSGRAREALLDAIVQHFVDAGVGDFTMRSLASALGTSHQLLMYHFGSRDDIARAALARIQQAVGADLEAFLDRNPGRHRPSDIWEHLSKPGPARLRVQFEFLGLALADPDHCSDFAVDILAGWTIVARRLLAGRKIDRRRREAATSLLVAAMRGLALDLMATDDRRRIRDAVRQLDRLFETL
jgi:AcrR family transcriptional regulator